MSQYTTEYFDELDLTAVSSIAELVEYSHEYQEECYSNSSTCIYDDEIVEEWIDNGMHDPDDDCGSHSIITLMLYANVENKRDIIFYETNRESIIEDILKFINDKSTVSFVEDDFFNEDDILQLAQHYVAPDRYDNPLAEEEEETNE